MTPLGRLLDVQFWLMGRDAEHPEGNLLPRLGFTRETPPEPRTGQTRYRREDAILWPFGLWLAPTPDAAPSPRAARPTSAAATPPAARPTSTTAPSPRAAGPTAAAPTPRAAGPTAVPTPPATRPAPNAASSDPGTLRGAHAVLVPRALDACAWPTATAPDVFTVPDLMAARAGRPACPDRALVPVARWLAAYERAVVREAGVGHRAPAPGLTSRLAPPRPCALHVQWDALARSLATRPELVAA
jgi:hypothetical protein